MLRIPLSYILGAFVLLFMCASGKIFANWFICFLSLIPILVYWLYIIVKSRNLPAKSIYNPFGFIELHIEKEANNNPYKFYRYCKDVITIARREKMGVLFYTWHVSEDRLYSIFGDAIEITKPSIIDRICLVPFSLFFQKVTPSRLPNSYIKCYINTERLHNEFFINRSTNISSS